MADNHPPGGEPESHPSRPRESATYKGAIIRLLQPIPLTVLMILIGVLLLLAANVLNLDNGKVLTRMADHEFARGLITYLFAVTTIGTSVVLVLAALTGGINDDAYNRGKEILALMLGVFGTIVGFYFGSEAHEAKAGEANAAVVSVSQPLVAEASLVGGGVAHLTAFVSGGTKPYSYGVTIGAREDLRYDQEVGANGWIVATVTAPAAAQASELRITLGVQDAKGVTAIRESVVPIRPGPKSP